MLSLADISQGVLGRIVVLGSCHLISDHYLDKEDNSKIKVSGRLLVSRTWFKWGLCWHEFTDQ